MKTSYFSQSAADRDDHVLRKMIADGHVPSTCLLGGSMVQQAVSLKMDPCSTCPCPKRDVCGGRDRSPTADIEELQVSDPARQYINDEASARRLQRKGFADKLKRMMAQAIKERGE